MKYTVMIDILYVYIHTLHLYSEDLVRTKKYLFNLGMVSWDLSFNGPFKRIPLFSMYSPASSLSHLNSDVSFSCSKNISKIDIPSSN